MSAIGSYRHRVTLSAPGPPVPTPDGGYALEDVPLASPNWYCAIAPASARDLETIGAGTVLSQATHVVRGKYHTGITTQTRVTFRGRVLNVVFVANREERNIETILVCAEVVE